MPIAEHARQRRQAARCRARIQTSGESWRPPQDKCNCKDMASVKAVTEKQRRNSRQLRTFLNAERLLAGNPRGQVGRLREIRQERAFAIRLLGLRPSNRMFRIS